MLIFELRRTSRGVEVSYRERNTGTRAKFLVKPRGAGELARMLDGTRVTDSTQPAHATIVGEVLEHVSRTA